jgi:excisionase family DNA binding protein
VNNEILDVKETSKYLKCSESFIRKLIRQNKIPYFRVGAKILFEKSKINQLIEKQTSSSEVIINE